MITSKEAREIFYETSPLIKYFDRVGDANVEKALKDGLHSVEFSIEDAPYYYAREKTAQLACEYYQSFGYKTKITHNNKSIELEW